MCVGVVRLHELYRIESTNGNDSVVVYADHMSRFAICLAIVAVAARAGQVELGAPLAATETTSIKKLVDTPDAYVDKTVQVKGKITEVCLMMGCWMMLHDEAGSAVRIKVNDGEIIFPKDSPGKQAVAEGKFVSFELTKEQAIASAKHEAEEMGREFAPSKVTGTQKVYQIQGSGAVVFD